jgi:uncharacterized protein YbcI
MTVTTEERHGRGEAQAAISNAIVGLLSEYTGRGPTRARTTMSGNLVVCVLEDTLTKGERSLVRNGRSALVLTTRRAFQDTMRDDIVAAVERITDRKAAAFMSDNHIDPDYAVEVVILEPADDDHPPGNSADGASA